MSGVNKWYLESEKTKRFDASGHVFKTHQDDDKVDIFALDHGYCNGPECAICGYVACWHCEPNPPKCKGVAK